MVGPAPPASRVQVTGPTRRLPAAAQRLALPLHRRSQERMAARWGFDLNTPDAAERAEALVSAAPGDADSLLVEAAVRSSRGDDAAALAAGRAAVRAAPSSARAHTTLATLLAHAGDRESAVAEAMLGAELDPDDPAALFNRGLLLLDGGDRRAAGADFRRAGAILGVDVRPWWRRLSRPA